VAGRLIRRGTEPEQKPKRRVLVLMTDGFGGHGGIALYLRDLLESLCTHPDGVEVVAVPRLQPNPVEPMPQNLRWVATGLEGKIAYTVAVLQEVLRNPDFDLVVCGHIHLLPLARALQIWTRAPMALFIYGIDAWNPTPSLAANLSARHVDACASISQTTLERFEGWNRLDPARAWILPNAIHGELYGLGAKPRHLLDRYGLDGRKTMMTLGRMVSLERYKGFRQVMQALAALRTEEPLLSYMMVGDGNDRPDLEAYAEELGIRDRVVFTGLVPESEKADHYRLADAYVMPSRGEGFGFVFLEALACGLPVVGSRLDGSREALRDGQLGRLVDPGNPEEIKDAIREALRTPQGIPEGLDYFSFDNFKLRCHRFLDTLWRE
jgi:glycosyltransferase involved in cell wall biosynthesis